MPVAIYGGIMCVYPLAGAFCYFLVSLDNPFERDAITLFFPGKKVVAQRLGKVSEITDLVTGEGQL